jgi:hypothetical protein
MMVLLGEKLEIFLSDFFFFFWLFSGWFALEFALYILQVSDGGGVHMGLAIADCRIAHNWVFFPIIHYLIRQSDRGERKTLFIFTVVDNFNYHICNCISG